ncbi:MAG: peptidase M14 [Spartobacteria bacterium]|nr:peptidase M14 [Spartobacteria bacterium]
MKKWALCIIFLAAWLFFISYSQARLAVRVWFPDKPVYQYWAARLDTLEADPVQFSVLALTDEQQFDALLLEGYAASIDAEMTARLQRASARFTGAVRGGYIPAYPCYRTVDQTYTDMAQYAAAYPSLVAVTNIGSSWGLLHGGGGSPIMEMTIGNRTNQTEKAHMFLMAAIHARELSTAETAMQFGEYLINEYGHDADITALLDYTQVHIVPQANPDGRKWAEQGYYWRKNVDNTNGCTTFQYFGTDLNRNSSYKWGMTNISFASCDGTYAGPGPRSEPETAALENRMQQIFGVHSGTGQISGIMITLHSYGNLVLFPPGWSEDVLPEHDALQTLGRKMGFYNHYAVMPAYELYPMSGANDDFAFGALGVPAYTFEMGTDFFEDCDYFYNAILTNGIAALTAAAKAARAPYISPSGPDVRSMAVQRTSPTGYVFTITAVANAVQYDSGGHGTEPQRLIQSARCSVDWPPWHSNAAPFAMSAVGATNPASERTFAGTMDLKQIPTGTHLIYVEAATTANVYGASSAVFVDNNLFQPVMDLISINSQGMTVQWNSNNDGLQYQLQCTDNLLNPEWISVDFPQAGDGSPQYTVIPPTNAPQQYYRIQVSPGL